MTYLTRQHFRALHRMCNFTDGESYYYDWHEVTRVSNKHYTLEYNPAVKPEDYPIVDLKIREYVNDQTLFVLREMYDNWIKKKP